MRIYNLSDDVIKLEKKSRRGQYIYKESFSLSREQADNILNSNYEFLLHLDNALARQFYLDIKTKLFRPKVIVDYIREAYILDYNRIRITFDKYLKTGLEEKRLFDEKHRRYWQTP